MLQFQQSEGIAERRRWILVLVDSSDGVTGKTGQTGTVFISKNGSAAVASTNNITEVDAGDMPGHYYIELTAAELDTLGHISITYKAADTLAFHDRAIISYNNPYQSVGGFSGGGGKGLTREQLEELLKKFIKAMKAEIAKIVIPEPLPFPEIADYSEAFQALMEKETDLTPVLEAVMSIEKPTDHTPDLKALSEQFKEFSKTHIDTVGFAKAIADFQGKMELATKDINGSLEEVENITKGFTELSTLMDEFKATLAEQSDMDKRFDSMSQAKNNDAIEGIKKSMAALAEQIVNLRYDIKESKE
jgi:hypothetical protein